MGEPAIVVREELGQDRVRRRGGVDAAQAQLPAEPILQRAPQPLDAALRLGRVRADVPDAELRQDPAQVGGVLRAPEFLVQGPMGIGPDENGGAVAVAGHGQAVRREHLGEERGIPVQILRGPEVQGQHGPGGIIQRAVERQPWPARLEPVRGTAVEEQQAAGPRGGGPAAPMARRAPRLRGRASQALPNPPDGLAAEPQAFDLVELLGQVTIVQAVVHGLHQRGDALAHGGGQAPRRGPAAPAVHQAARAARRKPLLEPVHVAHGHPQRPRHLARRHLPLRQGAQQPGPDDLLARHCEGLPCLHGGDVFT